MRRPLPVGYLVGLVAFGAAYYVLARFGMAAASLPGNIAPVWPAAGVAVGVCAVGGYRMWPGVAAGALLANFVTGIPLVAAAGMALGNTLEALLGAYLFTLATRGVRRLDRVADVLGFTGGSAVLATTTSATIGIGSLWLGGIIESSALRAGWQTWWVGDALGVMVVAPLVITCLPVLLRLDGARGGARAPALRRVEGGLLAGATAALSLLVFSGGFSHPYLLFPLGIWAAVRLGVVGAATSTLIVATFAVLGTTSDEGAFAQGSSSVDQLWLLDLFLFALALTGLVIAAAVRERDQVSGELRTLTESLTEESRERAAQLEREKARLEVLVDRERIARDLHDRVIQRIFAAGIQVGAQNREARRVGEESLPPRLHPDRFAAIEVELDAAIRELRHSIFDLGSIDDLQDRRQILAQAVDTTERVLGFRPEVVVVGDVSLLSDAITEQMVNVVRESLSNVAKHARASVVTVSVTVDEDVLVVSVDDDGIGMPDSPTRSSGITNLAKRAEDLGGKARWVRREPTGTTMIWQVPHGARPQAPVMAG